MKTLIAFYSYSGNIKKIAMKKAEETGADTVEFTDVKKRNAFSVYTLGCLSSMLRKKAKLNPVEADFGQYDKIMIAVPIWAGAPAAPFNNIAELIPQGKEAELIFSSGGQCSESVGKEAKELLEKRGVKVIGITYFKGDGER